MTNGEKIQTILDVDRDCTEVHGDNGSMTFTVTSDFWNAEYKEPSNSEKPNKSETPTGSTIKDDLVVDCISRADVNRIICEYRDDTAETGSERDLERVYGANEVGALISKLPSVTSIRPKGHWKYDYTSADGHRVYHCSECGCYLKPKTSEYLSDYKWCSLCGAKMEEVEE